MSINEIIEQQKSRAKGEEDDSQMEWGVGLVQKQQKEDQKAYEEREKNKPFARTADDADLNDLYKGQDRWGDPMLALMGVCIWFLVLYISKILICEPTILICISNPSLSLINYLSIYLSFIFCSGKYKRRTRNRRKRRNIRRRVRARTKTKRRRSNS